jgi:hypothetical protein
MVMRLRRVQPPSEIVSHAVWLYHVFSLRLRDVELFFAEQDSSSPTKPFGVGASNSAEAQHFLAAHAVIHGHIHPCRHLLSADAYRAIRSDAFGVWQQETCIQHAT